MGQTERTIEHRLKEHKRGFFTPFYTTSAAAEHALETNHEIDWSSAKVVDISLFIGLEHQKTGENNE